jgi:hypothetical protein
MERNKFLIYIIVALVLLNLLTLGSFWLGRSHHNSPPPGNRHETPGDVIVRELSFSTEQQNAFENLKTEHQQIIRPLQDSLRIYRDGLYDEKIFADKDRVLSHIAQINRIQQEIEFQTWLHFRKVNDLCTAEQKAKFFPVIRKAVRIMGGPPHPPGQHP